MAPQLSRLMIIFAVIILAFIIMRSVAQPDSFGWYGHYRGKALTEISSRDVEYIKSSECADCHDEEAAQHARGPHAVISCQACHGPGRLHVEDPSTDNIQRPDVVPFCLRCHGKTSAKPHSFPQIVAAEHTEGKSCGSCHLIHDPTEFKE